MSCKTFRETLIDQYQEISTIKFLTKQAVRIWARIHTNIHTDKFVYDLGFSCNSSQIVPSRRQFWLLASLSVRLGFDWWVPQSGFVRCSSSHWCFVLSNRHWVLTVFFIQAPIQFCELRVNVGVWLEDASFLRDVGYSIWDGGHNWIRFWRIGNSWSRYVDAISIKMD